jgi:hypothetical protein
MRRSTALFLFGLAALAVYRYGGFEPGSSAQIGQATVTPGSTGGRLEINFGNQVGSVPLMVVGVASKYGAAGLAEKWAFHDTAPTVLCGKTSVALALVGNRYIALNGRTSGERARSRLYDGAGNLHSFIGTSDNRGLRNAGLTSPGASDIAINETTDFMLRMALAQPRCQ